MPPIPATDQKVGGSSPSERAAQIRPKIHGRQFVLPDLAGSVPIEVDSKNFHCTIRDDENGNTSLDV